MNTPRANNRKFFQPIKPDFTEVLWEKSWTNIKTVVDVVHEPVLILDKGLRVKAANESFYRTFLVKPIDTEGKIVYELGNGQWNIPSLKNLLEDILPKRSFFKGYEVRHEFPKIGHRIIILNARQIFVKDDIASNLFPPIILLAMEDVTKIMTVAEEFADYANQTEIKSINKTQSLEIYVVKLEKNLARLEKKINDMK